MAAHTTGGASKSGGDSANASGSKSAASSRESSDRLGFKSDSGKLGKTSFELQMRMNSKTLILVSLKMERVATIR